ncbi:MAG: ethanolamine utilization microcompartment protein EutL [Archangiaceae bacterium]|nr:ethanolamine utilization microcompartment protein EutL [Archangiaceae bacterium]
MLVRLPPKLLSCRLLEQVEPSLGRALGCSERHVSVGIVTCDQDDSLYAALDHATKFADVDVVYAKSFYAGSAHASGPFSGEIMGVLAGPNPDEVKEGLWALREALTSRIHFVAVEGTTAPAFFPHVIEETGRYLAPLAGVAVGSPLAYLIAPPTEAMIGLDAALKSASVKLLKFFGPPTETNFAGGYLGGGSVADVRAAADAFSEAVESVVRSPMAGLVRPERERR